MACNAMFVPTYKKAKQTIKNPYYGSWDPNLASLGINTTDEFITTELMVEGAAVCAACRKERCSEERTREVHLS